MDVELYVYDLSGGMARQYSQALTGVQIDAIYHTAIVLNHVEYFFGQGIHRKIPGSTHHGRPMKIIKLGKTELPMEVIEEYIQSLESIYTPESYDLFLHNCNNFTQDLSVFLVGKSIPEEISSLPETFLRTPIGQVLRGQLDQSMRTMTQAPDAVAGAPTPKPVANRANGVAKPNGTTVVSKPSFFNSSPPKTNPGQVYNITDASTLSKLLQRASNSCAVIFFTSATCPPCKLVYPAYDELAQEAGDKAILIKVDTSQAYEIASRYSIRATPTFMTFLKGQKEDTWSGANEAKLRGNVQLLLQMAHPAHPRTDLNLPSFRGLVESPITYAKMPPLDKLAAKLSASIPDHTTQPLISYIKSRESSGMANTPIPDLPTIFSSLTQAYTSIPLASRFALVDLTRISALDPRVSSYLATESSLSTLKTILTSTPWTEAPYQLRLTTAQFLTNLFVSPVFQEQLCNPPSPILKLITECSLSDILLSDNPSAAQATSAFYYNLSCLNHNERIHKRPDVINIPEDVEVALVSAVVNETGSKESLHAFLLTLGMMLYMAPGNGQLWELCAAMEVEESLGQKEGMEVFMGEGLVGEVGRELLEKGKGKQMFLASER
jgi:desumoylating isopeptidase 1